MGLEVILTKSSNQSKQSKKYLADKLIFRDNSHDQSQVELVLIKENNQKVESFSELLPYYFALNPYINREIKENNGEILVYNGNNLEMKTSKIKISTPDYELVIFPSKNITYKLKQEIENRIQQYIQPLDIAANQWFETLVKLYKGETNFEKFAESTLKLTLSFAYTMLETSWKYGTKFAKKLADYLKNKIKAKTSS